METGGAILHPISYQLKMARDWCIEILEICPAESVDVQLKAFNNTIRWQTGHILSVAERMLFHVPPSTGMLPSAFTKWFDSGSRPSDWVEQPPSLTELITMLRSQQKRILDIAPEEFDSILDAPYYGFSNYGEIAGFVIVHEAFHVGQIVAMMRA
ncbi:DinB family protein [Cohnella lupini]|nr:DinB family protein [Cohnella lupini]